ncbi:MAG: hypothetical protein GY866_37630 [Proteobacteria bacterium]|nr:hypothetical protein [Pseudomonadota bacterium]
MKTLNKPWIGFSLSSVLFVLICSFFWDDMPMSESVFFWMKAETFEKAISFRYHPPLYTLVFHPFYLLFGGKFLGGYAVGMVSVILSGGLVLAILKSYDSGILQRSRVVWSILIGYYSLPLIVHGAFIFDIDNTILTPALLLAYLTYLRFQKQANAANGAVLFLTVSLSFWCKTTTPFLLLFSIAFCHLIKRDLDFLFLKLMPVFATAVACFYFLYGRLYTNYFLRGVGSFQISDGKVWNLLAGENTFQLPLNHFIFSIGSSLGALVVWSSPFLVLMFLTIFWQIVRNREIITLKRLDAQNSQQYLIPLMFVTITVIAYTFLLKVQASAGFPKYHYPIFAFLFVLLGMFLSKTETRFRNVDVLFFLAMGAVYAFVVKDMLYEFYSLGRAHQLTELALYVSKTASLMILPFIIYCLLRKPMLLENKYNVLAVMVVFLITINLSGLISRSQAEYSTNYHYGVGGTKAAVEFANTIPVEKSIAFPFAGYFITQNPSFPGSQYGRLLGHSPTKPETDYIIITDQMLYGNKYLYGIDYVKKRYERIKTIQSYGVWKKKR